MQGSLFDLEFVLCLLPFFVGNLLFEKLELVGFFDFAFADLGLSELICKYDDWVVRHGLMTTI